MIVVKSVSGATTRTRTEKLEATDFKSVVFTKFHHGRYNTNGTPDRIRTCIAL